MKDNIAGYWSALTAGPGAAMTAPAKARARVRRNFMLSLVVVTECLEEVGMMNVWKKLE